MTVSLSRTLIPFPAFFKSPFIAHAPLHSNQNHSDTREAVQVHTHSSGGHMQKNDLKKKTNKRKRSMRDAGATEMKSIGDQTIEGRRVSLEGLKAGGGGVVLCAGGRSLSTSTHLQNGRRSVAHMKAGRGLRSRWGLPRTSHSSPRRGVFDVRWRRRRRAPRARSPCT